MNAFSHTGFETESINKKIPFEESLYIRLQWINDFYMIVLIDLDNLLSNFLPVELGAEFLIKKIFRMNM